MERSLEVTVGPAMEPISLAEAKAHLRVDHTDEDAVIRRLIGAARRRCELVARRAFVSQTLALKLARWPRDGVIRLWRPPLQSVSSIVYVDSAGDSATWDGENYVVEAGVEPPGVWLGYGKQWPTATLRPGLPITVTYVAGYGDAEDVPETYRQAVLLMVGHYFENREAVVVQAGVTGLTLPLAVEDLLLVDRG